MRTIAVLGATGSIGTQTLDLARRYPERFRVNCLAANASKEKLFALVREFRPEAAALVCEPDEIPEDLRFCEWFFGHDACVNALKAAKSQDALCAIVGIAGLDAVLAALDVSERVLLANKEALVTGGNLVMEKAKRLNKPLLPVDTGPEKSHPPTREPACPREESLLQYITHFWRNRRLKRSACI